MKQTKNKRNIELRARQTGKTTVIAKMIKECLNEGLTVWYAAHHEKASRYMINIVGNHRNLTCGSITASNCIGSNRYDNIFIDNFDLIDARMLYRMIQYQSEAVIRMYGSYETTVRKLLLHKELDIENSVLLETLDLQRKQLIILRKSSKLMTDYISSLETTIFRRDIYNKDAGILYRSSMNQRKGKFFFDGEE